jgi:hypothetical protein
VHKNFCDQCGRNLEVTPNLGHPDPAKIMENAGWCVYTDMQMYFISR